jgi:predicted ATP-dependent endonuclease of OLD family
MKFKQIEIINYRSIESLTFDIEEINGSYTYSLLGVNESGKSSFLKAITLVNGDAVDFSFPHDYNDDNKSVIIKLFYTCDEITNKNLQQYLIKMFSFPKEIIGKVLVKEVEIYTEYMPDINKTYNYFENITFETNLFKDYKYSGKQISKILKEDFDFEEPNILDLNKFFKENLEHYFWDLIHNIVFWKSSPEFLLLDEIDLNAFAEKPKKISIPLLNCFILSGFNSNTITKEISKLTSPARINSLQSILSDKITKHIRLIWPEHPISISFQISDNKISLLIEDDGIKYKPKTTNQRSDGFKQFISFLLTISVESHNEELTNTILLIDEPELHLHPPAQINLLKELVKITSNNKNNVLFFATHSNYLIDKDVLDRNFKVKKENNSCTKITRIEKKSSTYAEVNCDIFGIYSTDYHNELYGYIESENVQLLNNLSRDKTWVDSRDNKEKKVSLSLYIRHSIHHPENKLNKRFTDKELEKSIKVLLKLKEEIDIIDISTEEAIAG